MRWIGLLTIALLALAGCSEDVATDDAGDVPEWAGGQDSDAGADGGASDDGAGPGSDDGNGTTPRDPTTENKRDPTCYDADNYGVSVSMNEYTVYTGPGGPQDIRVYEESNGYPGLQTMESCPSNPDSRVV